MKVMHSPPYSAPWFMLLLFIAMVGRIVHAITESQTVSTDSGKVKGTVLYSTKGRPYHAFRGIPYAKPPINDLRFKPPQPVDQWGGVLDVTQDTTQCPQYNFIVRGVDGQEDCLVINVYTPQVKQKNVSLSVLFFIHGGAFILGSGTFMYYGASRLMDQDVVLVTFNYRIGVLGFLSTGDENCPGNYGLLDQVLALQWVRKNIAQFGGDRDKVTLFGESAGAISVTHLMLSPLAKGLFRLAIAQSGSSLNNWAIQKDPLSSAIKIGKKLSCPIDDTKEIVDCMRRIPYKDIIRKVNEFQAGSLMFPLFLLPVVEKFGSRNAFLDESPAILLQEGRIASKVPLIIGINKEEGFPFYKDYTRNFGNEHFTDDFTRFIADIIGSEYQQIKKVMPIIREEYTKELQNVEDREQGFIMTFSDLLFGSGVNRLVEMMSDAGIPTYAYVYTFIGKHSFAEILGGDPGKYCGHADELFIQFDFFFAQISPTSPAERKMASILNSLWANFAQTLKPSFSKNLFHDSLEWKPYNTTNPVYMELNLNPTLRNGSFCNRTQFWADTIPLLIRDHGEKEL